MAQVLPLANGMGRGKSCIAGLHKCGPAQEIDAVSASG